MSTKRTFIAIEFPTEVTRAIQQFNAALHDNLKKQQLERAARFVTPQNIHLTLRFLGDTSPSQLSAIQQGLQQIAPKHTPFNLQLHGLGCFPNLRKPSVVWTALIGASNTIANLQRDVEALVQRAGYVAESRTFQPHITLARIERSASASDVRRLGAWVEQMSVSETVKSWSADLAVQQISFIESTLTPTGSIYTSLGRFALGS